MTEFYADPDPPLTQFILPVFTLFLLSTVPQLLAWTVTLAYAGVYIFPVVIVVIIVKYVVYKVAGVLATLQCLVEREALRTQKEANKGAANEMRWRSILLSLISPCVVGHHGSSMFRVSVGLTFYTQAMLMVPVYLIARYHGFEMGDEPPLTHCMRTNVTEHVGETCIHDGDSVVELCGQHFFHFSVLCYRTERRVQGWCERSAVRFCEADEDATAMLTKMVIPLIAGLLVFSLAIGICLAYLTDYRTYYSVTKYVRGSGPHGIVHWSLLHELALDASSENSTALVDELMTMEPSSYMTDAANHADSMGRTPLHLCCAAGNHAMATMLLLLYRCYHNAQDVDGETPLHVACKVKNLELVALLLATDSDVGTKNKAGGKALTWGRLGMDNAAVQAWIEAVSDVAKRIDMLKVSFLLKKRRKPTYFSWIQWDTKESIKVCVLNKRDATDRTLLAWATEFGQLDVVETLLGDDAVSDDMPGRDSALSKAAQVGHVGIVKAMLKRRPKVDLLHTDQAGKTVLIFAAANGRLDIAELLLSECADVHKLINATCNEGCSALIYATRNSLQTEVRDLLLDRPELDINARLQGTLQRTVLIWAARRDKDGSLVTALLEKRQEIDVNAGDAGGNSALISAVARGREEAAMVLLSHPKVDVNVQNEWRETALIWAAKAGMEAVAAELLAREGIMLDVRRKIDGKTAMEVAALESTSPGHAVIAEAIQKKEDELKLR